MRILLATWYDAAWHPMTIFTSQVLSEQGHAVSIVYRRPNPERTIPGSVDYGSRTHLHSVGRGQVGWRNQIAYLGFIRQVMKVTLRFQPDIMVGYDMHGIVAAHKAQLLRPEARLVYHNFDLVSRELLSAYGRIVKDLEGSATRAADLVIASSPGRAKALYEDNKLDRMPLVLLNCQRRKDYEGPRGELHNILNRQELFYDRLVVRLGSLGPQHGIETTIRSIPMWRGNWGLVLAGIGSDDYVQSLRTLISGLELDGRVVLLSPVSYDLWYDCLFSADLGIALYEKGNINHDTMAGAGNKLNLHLKAGIPSIVPNIPDFITFINTYGVGYLADPGNPESIAEAVNAILADVTVLHSMSHNAKMAFSKEFNFEKQIEPFLLWLSGRDTTESGSSTK